jgi:hypothetical protein
VVFKPRSSGTFSATLTVPDTSGGTAASVTLTARAIGSCKRGAQGPEHSFGEETPVHERSKERVAIPWDWCYDGGAISLSDTSDFGLLSPTSCPPREGDACAALVIFRPTSPGPHSTTLVVRDRDGGVGVSVPITAVATGSCTVQGGSEVTGAKVGRTVERSVGFQRTPCLDGATYSLEGDPAFRLTGNTCTSPGSGPCGFVFGFTPSRVGMHSAKVLIRDRAGRYVGSYTVSAMGRSPDGEKVPCRPDPDGCPNGFTTPPEESPSDAPSTPAPTPSPSTPSSRPSTRAPGSHSPSPAPKPLASGGLARPKHPETSHGPTTDKPRSAAPKPRKTDAPDGPDKPALPHPDPSTTPTPGPTSSGRSRAVPAT